MVVALERAALVQLARSLPPPLQRFLARWPPASILPADGAPTPTAFQARRPDPFCFWRNPKTGRLQDPVYSMRRQAELVRMAREHGIEELLPETTKGTEYQLAHRVEHGLRVKGTGVGQKVKGHKFERDMAAKYAFSPIPPCWTFPRRALLVANGRRAGWRCGERPCWTCPDSSGSGSA